MATSAQDKNKRKKGPGRQTRNSSVSAAEEIPECSSCVKQLPKGVDAVGCERCQQWICRECAGLSVNEYQFISDRRDLHWYCNGCQAAALQAVKNDAIIEERCKEIMAKCDARLDEFEEKLLTKADKPVVDQIDSRTIALENKISSLALDVTNLSKKLDMVRFEPFEKDKRKNNVVVRGAPEGSHPDIDIVKRILSDIGCEDVEIVEISRLGRHRNAPVNPSNNQNGSQDNSAPVRDPIARPIRVALRNPETKGKVLKNASKIRRSRSTDLFNPKKIFLVPDQTALERRDDIDLRRKLQEKREAEPEREFIIRKRKIIPRPAASANSD